MDSGAAQGNNAIKMQRATTRIITAQNLVNSSKGLFGSQSSSHYHTPSRELMDHTHSTVLAVKGEEQKTTPRRVSLSVCLCR